MATDDDPFASESTSEDLFISVADENTHEVDVIHGHAKVHVCRKESSDASAAVTPTTAADTPMPTAAPTITPTVTVSINNNQSYSNRINANGGRSSSRSGAGSHQRSSDAARIRSFLLPMSIRLLSNVLRGTFKQMKST